MANDAGFSGPQEVVATVSNVTAVSAGVPIIAYTGQCVVSAYVPPTEGQLWPRQVIRQ